MKWLKVFVFVAVCGLTWLTTNALRAQFRQNVAPQFSLKSIETREIEPEAYGVLSRDPNAIPANFFQVKDLKAVVQDQVAIVSGTAHLQQLQRNWIPERYFWKLSCLRADGSCFAEQVYPDQPIDLNPPATIQPTFADVIPIPPGRSRIRLSLLAIPPTVDPRLLQDREFARDHSGPWSTIEVEAN